jgi:type II secretory pathway pseudopilin PulG
MYQVNRRPCTSPAHVGRLAVPVRAFTLLELLIVLSLLILLALLAWPAMANRMQSSELPESASRLRSTLYMARNGAVMEHRRVRVRFEEDIQQPIVEIERDPFGAVGVFEQVAAAWTQEPVMIGEAQVHSVSLGRPEFLKPLSEEVNPNSGATDAATDSPEETDTGAKTDETLALRTSVELKEDPNRPTILFEPDGSTDWALLVVARQFPGEELLKNSDQRWVIVDGRTGMITVRDGLTEEELADPDLCVSRKKLEPPDLNKDITETGLQTAAASSGTPQGDGATSGLDSGLADIGEQGQGALDQALGTGQKPPADAAGAESNQNGRRGSQIKKPKNGMMSDPTAEQQQPKQSAQDFQADTIEELQQKLSQSDLSDEEKQQILDSFQAGNKDR